MAGKGKHPNSAKALELYATKQYKPGQSGNPGGRPKYRPMTEAYLRLLKKKFNLKNFDPKAKPPTFKTNADALAYYTFISGLKGKTQAAIEIADRVEGRATQRVELAPDIETVEALSVEVVFVRPDGSRSPGTS